jgi:hypothetical protein
MTGAFYRQSQIEWGPRTYLREDGKPQREIRFPGLLQRPRGNGFLFVTAFEQPEMQQRRIQETESLRGELSPAATTELWVFVTDSTGNVDASRRMILDTGSYVSRCLGIEITDDGGQRRWPLVSVRYRGHYGTQQWFGSIDWNILVDLATERVLESTPVAIDKGVAPGQRRRDLLESSVAGGELRVMSRRNGRRLALPCGAPCVIDGRSLLEVW